MPEFAVSTSIEQWLSECRICSELVVEQIPLQACDKWDFVDGVFKHQTGKFFSIIGIECENGPPHLKGLTLPMIDQPEVGILGFVVRRASTGWQWLLQAKTEPGNVMGTQVGPSVQATRSNYLQVHGGQPTPMIELFTDPQTPLRTITNVEQSEQGDRFLGKYNLNSVVEVTPEFQAPCQNAWRWFDACTVREALTHDFTFNTDARSVLCCTDWSLLCSPGEDLPFARWHAPDGFGFRLALSHSVPLTSSGCSSAIDLLETTRRTTTLRINRIALQALRGWRCTDWAIECLRPDIDPVVRAFRVHSADREVQDWCQPLLTNRSEGQAVLACSEYNGVLQFFIPARIEPGFHEYAQFGPSFLTGLGHENSDALHEAIHHPSAIVHRSVRQSDEGGRFKDSVALYQIIEIPPKTATALAPMGSWVTLSALRYMASVRGLLSNELRSCISLLLSWV